MRFLFIDEEFALSKGDSVRVCSFGYVLTDEKFNILEQDDIFINPESAFDRYVLDNILNHDEKFYSGYPNMKDSYERIKNLFEEDVIVIGHEVGSDVHALNSSLKRYSLPPIDFRFFDSKLIYNDTFQDSSTSASLDKISLELGVLRQGDKHESHEDALIVYEQMKKISDVLNTDLYGIISLVKYMEGSTINFKISAPKRRRNIKQVSHNSLLLRQNNIDFNLFISTVKRSKDLGCDFDSKKITFDSLYTRDHYKEMLYMIQRVYDYGGTYVRTIADADVIVSDNRFICISNKEGKKMETMLFREFKDIIGYDEREMNRFFRKHGDTIMEDSSSFEGSGNISSIGELFSDFFKDKNE